MRMLYPPSPLVSPLPTIPLPWLTFASIIVKYSAQFHVRLRISVCVANVTHKFIGIIC